MIQNKIGLIKKQIEGLNMKVRMAELRNEGELTILELQNQIIEKEESILEIEIEIE